MTLPLAVLAHEFGLGFGFIVVISFLMSMLYFILLPISLLCFPCFSRASLCCSEWAKSVALQFVPRLFTSSLRWRKNIGYFDVFVYTPELGISENQVLMGGTNNLLVQTGLNAIVNSSSNVRFLRKGTWKGHNSSTWLRQSWRVITLRNGMNK